MSQDPNEEPTVTSWTETTPAAAHPGAVYERLRGCRVDAGWMNVVIVQYRHSNSGHFEDFGLWVRQDGGDWMPGGGNPDLSDLLTACPDFAPLFADEKDPA